MTNTYSIHHIHVKCPDARAVAEWYCTVFGFEVVADDTRPTGDRLIRCALGENRPPFLIVSNPASDQNLPEGHAGLALGLEHFAITTPNLGSDLEKVVAHGAQVLDGPIALPDGTVIVFVRAPGNVRIELVQFPD